MENKYLKHPFPVKFFLTAIILTTITVPVVMFMFGLGPIIALLAFLAAAIIDLVLLNVFGFYPVVESDRLLIRNCLSGRSKEYRYSDILRVEIIEETSDKYGSSYKMVLYFHNGKKLSKNILVSEEMLYILCQDLQEKGVPEVTKR